MDEGKHRIFEIHQSLEKISKEVMIDGEHIAIVQNSAAEVIVQILFNSRAY